MQENDCGPGRLTRRYSEITGQRNARFCFDFDRPAQFFGLLDLKRAWSIDKGRALEFNYFSIRKNRFSGDQSFGKYDRSNQARNSRDA